MSARRYYIAILFMGFAALLSLASQAQAADSQICQLHTAGMIISMRAAIESQAPADVAMQRSGLVPGGPRSRMADLAYRLLSAKNPEGVVRQRVQALCLTLGADAVEDDAPTFNATIDGGGAQVCSDVATSVAELLKDPAYASIEEILIMEFTYETLADGRTLKKPVDAVRAALMVGDKRARQGADKRTIMSSVMAYCEALKPPARALLDQQFYK